MPSTCRLEAQRHFDGIATDTHYDALSHGGWFATDRGGKPRYTPIGILHIGTGSI